MNGSGSDHREVRAGCGGKKAASSLSGRWQGHASRGYYQYGLGAALICRIGSGHYLETVSKEEAGLFCCDGRVRAWWMKALRHGDCATGDEAGGGCGLAA